MYRTRSLVSSTADEGVRRVCGKPRGEGYSFVSCFSDQGRQTVLMRTLGVVLIMISDLLRLILTVFTRRVVREVKKKVSIFAPVLRFICYLFLWSSFHFMSVTYIYLHTFSSILNLHVPT